MTHSEKIIDTLKPLLANQNEVAFVMYPNHWNVGDSAIWYGTVIALKTLGINVNYIANHQTYDPQALARYNPSGAILICGGGNFGDLYQDEVSVRTRVLEDFPKRKIIQLPQSIWYKDTAAAQPIAELIKRASDFTLLVREHESLERAKTLLDCDAILCPDMAFMLEGNLKNKETKNNICKYRVLKRKDGESNTHTINDRGANEILTTDWAQETRAYKKSQWSPLGWISYKLVQRWIRGKYTPMTLLVPAANRLARERTEAGLRLLHEGVYLLTDRLHAGILAAITQQPTALVDNSYGKNSSVYNAWLTSGYPVQIFKSFESGLENFQTK